MDHLQYKFHYESKSTNQSRDHHDDHSQSESPLAKILLAPDSHNNQGKGPSPRISHCVRFSVLFELFFLLKYLSRSACGYRSNIQEYNELFCRRILHWVCVPLQSTASLTDGPVHCPCFTLLASGKYSLPKKGRSSYGK